MWTGLAGLAGGRAAVFGTNTPHPLYPRLGTKIVPCPRLGYQIDGLNVSLRTQLPI